MRTSLFPQINSLRLSDAYMLINHHWFRQWRVTWPAPSHYLNQCCNIVNWTLRNKFQWHLNRNALKNVVWKMAAILSRPQCVKTYLMVQCHQSLHCRLQSIQVFDDYLFRPIWSNILYLSHDFLALWMLTKNQHPNASNPPYSCLLCDLWYL